MQLISVQHAAATALASYIGSTFSTAGVTADANTHWPQASKKLPAKAVTVLTAGEMEKLLAPPLVLQTAAASGNKLTYTIQQYQCRQPMQLDVWARSHPELDDLMARLDDMLNVGTSALAPPANFNAEPFGEGVVLQLGAKNNATPTPAQWNGTVSFLFESFVDVESPDPMQRSEYRASARGFADFAMTTDRQITQLLSPYLKLKTHEVGAAGSPPSSMLFDIYQIVSGSTGTGFVYSTGP